MKSSTKENKMARKRDKIYWVVQERTKLFTWRALSLHKTKQSAEASKALLELHSPLSFAGFKVDRVELVD